MAGPVAGASEAKAAREPLLRMRSAGDGAAILGSLALLAGGVLLQLSPSPDPAHLPIALVLMVGVLTFLQSISAVSPLGKFLMSGAAGVGGGALLLSVWLVTPEAGVGPLFPGLALGLLGVLGSLGAVELLRREVGMGYVAMATRAVEIAQEPQAQRAALKLLIPWAIVGIAALVILDFGAEFAGKVAFIALQYFFNPVGKEFAIVCGLNLGVPCPQPPMQPLQVGVLLVFIDFTTALFLAWNYQYMLRVPFVGFLLRWVEEHGRKAVAKRAWIRRLAFFGVLFYAAGPFEGTGAIGGTIVGRTIGLDAMRTLVAVVSGSILRTTLFLIAVVAGVHVFNTAVESGLGLALGVGVGLLVAASLGAWLWWRRRRARNERAAKAE